MTAEKNYKKRLLAIAVLAAVLTVMLFSSCYIIEEADHDCSGASCEICAMLAQCGENLRQLGALLTAALVLAAAAVLLCKTFSAVISTINFETLISHKVRLNN